jgi:hypothetical protein
VTSRLLVIAVSNLVEVDHKRKGVLQLLGREYIKLRCSIIVLDAHRWQKWIISKCNNTNMCNGSIKERDEHPVINSLTSKCRSSIKLLHRWGCPKAKNIISVLLVEVHINCLDGGAHLSNRCRRRACALLFCCFPPFIDRDGILLSNLRKQRMSG